MTQTKEKEEQLSQGEVSPTLLIWRKEVSGYLTSTTGHIVITLNALLLGGFFTIFIELLNQVPTDVPITELFYDSYFFWILLFIGAPVITTRTFSLEASRGTLDAILATPTPTFSVVLGKWAASVTFFLLTWIPWLGCMAVIYTVPSTPPPFYWEQWASTGLGLLLMGGFFISIGCLFSSMTSNQIVSAMATFVLCLGLFSLSFLDQWSNPNKDLLRSFISQIGIVNHMGDFARGIIDTRPIVFYVTSTFFCLYLTTITLEKRRWLL